MKLKTILYDFLEFVKHSDNAWDYLDEPGDAVEDYCKQEGWEDEYLNKRS